MRIRSLRFIAASCALSTIPTLANAQVGQAVPATRPAQGQIIQGQPIQGQPIPGQVIQGQVIRDGQPVTPGQAVRPGQAVHQGQHGGQHHSAGVQGQTSVENFFVKKLMLCNKQEIELGQLATQKASNDEVKKFAQMLVSDHQQLNDKLTNLRSGDQGDSGNQSGQNANQDSQANSAQRQSTPGQAGQGQNGQGQNGQGQSGQQSQMTGAQGQQVPQQLTAVLTQASQRQLEMAKEMLQEHEGQDFDMGFLGMQIVAHAQTKAELQAMQNVGSSQFQELVRGAEQKVSQHLDEAKTLAKKLKDKNDSE
jgi:predicted outer membrane protein